MKKWKGAAVITVAVICVPQLLFAQAAENIKGLHGVLENLYNDMMPLCSQLIGVGRGIAGFGALWYIASRVWKHLANAEPIDFYPLFRPFVLGFCISFFPLLLGTINFLMKPMVTGTAAMVNNSNAAIAELLKKKEEAIKGTDAWKMYVGINKEGDREMWYKYTHPDMEPSQEGMFDKIGNNVQFAIAKASYNFRNSIKVWMSDVLQVLFQAASLCINTLRTFQLVVLSILGPLVFGIAVFDGFGHTLTAWLAKYINIFLWLPVANIFGAIIGKIQENMLKEDLTQIGITGNTFFSITDTGYLIFMLIGIVGYFTVPSVASFVVNAGGGGAMMQKMTSMLSSSPAMLMSTTGRMGAGAANMVNMGRDFSGKSGDGSANGMAGESGAFTAGRMIGGAGAYMADKLSGRSEKK
ncbi:conjugative transposon protein TraJ [Chitinophaga barathri]|uniref:Conjugative transposon protein TraJ n=1 Tax=Chitinophaga barathri TaxID=1647451 RepID=A0A3N4M7M9_9BACT|nr:conjugative transposon protein TraJ [Chitinophaga barathri]RPD39341.1 conjugative transposon protein TraJ [Chitinophaga barathri]